MTEQTEPDYKQLAQEMGEAMAQMLTMLVATRDWTGTLSNRETGERYTWEEMFARLIERLPGMTIDRRYLEAKHLPAKARHAEFRRLNSEQLEKRKAREAANG